MPSPDVLDMDALLAPISAEQPAGPPLRGGDAELNSLFYAISDARKEARNSERQKSLYEMTQGTANPVPAPKPADWGKVVELGKQIVATKSKDLWVAAWMLEGLCRTEGYAGLRDAFRLVRQLCEKYWDNIHPRSDTDPTDVSTIVAQLAGVFDGVLTTPICDIPVTGSYPRTGADMARRYSISDYRLALQLDKQADPKQRRQQVERGAVTMEEFMRAVNATSAESFRNRLGDIDRCVSEFNDMAKELDNRCGIHAAPPTSKTREALEDCRNRVSTISKDILAAADAAAQLASDAEGQMGSTPGPGPVPGSFNSREQALQTLLKVADYFRQHEPHSVVSYSLEQIVRWGRMSLPELLTELVSDKKSRQEIFRQTGISAKQDDAASD